MNDPRPLIVHVVYSFHTGGLENGLVNIINRLPHERFRHTIIALTTCAPTCCQRIVPDDVHFIEICKPPGHALRLYPRLYSLFRELKPAILHTRNMAALETVVPARAAGVPVRIHGEHGWDVTDPDGRSARHRMIRRLYRPFVSHYVALSAHLIDYLAHGIGVPTERITRICNGVDTRLFCPATAGREPLAGSPFNASNLRVIGTVGRLQTIKDQISLVRAFALLRRHLPQAADALRLMIVGDGPMRGEVAAETAANGLGTHVWLAGERADVPDVMRAMDVFVLPSRAEGISNTILEAMASGLPVVATDVGGNVELVVEGETGTLVPASNSAALADALTPYVLDAMMAHAQGEAGRRRVESGFSLDSMVTQYANLYEAQLRGVGWGNQAEPAIS